MVMVMLVMTVVVMIMIMIRIISCTIDIEAALSILYISPLQSSEAVNHSQKRRIFETLDTVGQK